MSGSLDTSFLFETIAKDDEVNLPPDVMERELKKREARARKEAQEAVLTRKVENLEKIEKKTEKLLKKAQKRGKDVQETSQKRAHNVPKACNKRTTIKRKASLIEYRCMRGLKKDILLNITKNRFDENGISKSLIDTEEIMRASGKKAHAVRKAVMSMKEEGWFEVNHSAYSGVREITIDPDNYPTLQ